MNMPRMKEAYSFQPANLLPSEVRYVRTQCGSSEWMAVVRGFGSRPVGIGAIWHDSGRPIHFLVNISETIVNLSESPTFR